MIRVYIVTVSDSVAAGTREDLSGPALMQKATELGWQVVETKVVSDDPSKVASAVKRSSGIDVILTTGGTGVAPRDITTEATKAAAEREIPGFGELMRLAGSKHQAFILSA